jgi:hypothetical protein
MEYYDRVKELLDIVGNRKKPHDDALSELTSLFTTESARELYLIVSEWNALRPAVSASLFLELSPIFFLLLDRLRNSSPLISRDLIEALYRRLAHYSPEDLARIQAFFQPRAGPESSAAFRLFVSLLLPDLSAASADQLLHDFLGDDMALTDTLYHSFWSLPVSSRLALRRCALHFASALRSLGLERIALLLLDSGLPWLERDGVTIGCSVSDPTSPNDLFRAIVSRGPFMPTLEAARAAWAAASRLLDAMNEGERYHIIRAQLERSDLAEATRSALTHRVMAEMRRPEPGIFRSPLAAHFLPLAFDQALFTSPTGKVEAAVTALSFVHFVLLVDRSAHCFQVLGNAEVMARIDQLVTDIRRAVVKAARDNRRRPEQILAELRKVNIGKQFAEEDAEVIVAQTEMAITRINFAIGQIQDILDGK